MRILLAVLLLGACGKPGHRGDDGRDLATRLIGDSLDDAAKHLAAHDSIAVGTDCLMVGSAGDHIPQPLVARVITVCGIDAPKLLLQDALADIKRHHGDPPELAELNCVELLAPEALMLIAKNPAEDAELKGLVAEYAQRCPKAYADGQASAVELAKPRVHDRKPRLGEEMLEDDLAEVEKAVAADNAAGVELHCMDVRPRDSYPDALSERAVRLCGVDGPKLVLRHALATLTPYAGNPGYLEDKCIVSDARDAFRMMKRNPSDDAELKRLVAELARLCPKQNVDPS